MRTSPTRSSVPTNRPNEAAIQRHWHVGWTRPITFSVRPAASWTASASHGSIDRAGRQPADSNAVPERDVVATWGVAWGPGDSYGTHARPPPGRPTLFAG